MEVLFTFLGLLTGLGCFGGASQRLISYLIEVHSCETTHETFLKGSRMTGISLRTVFKDIQGPVLLLASN